MQSLRHNTGEKAPYTGRYGFDGHMEYSTCRPTANERVIPLSAGERFPPCRSCETGAYWRFISA